MTRTVLDVEFAFTSGSWRGVSVDKARGDYMVLTDTEVHVIRREPEREDGPVVQDELYVQRAHLDYYTVTTRLVADEPTATLTDGGRTRISQPAFSGIPSV